ncbi:MAG: RluA family pseudouridine synthase [Chitinophagales bacterium]
MERLKIAILYQDPFIVLVNKPCGIMTEPDQFGHDNVLDILKAQLNPQQHKNFFLQNVHRLDRPVSGVLAFALKPSVVKKWNAEFRGDSIQKEYLARVSAALPAPRGELQHYLWKDQKNWRSEVKATPFAHAQPVRLAYEVLKESEGNFLLRIELFTGKYHQIRAQLALVGCPIIGDEKYGSTVSYQPNAIALHAHRLTFRHPARGNTLSIDAPWTKAQ